MYSAIRKLRFFVLIGYRKKKKKRGKKSVIFLFEMKK